MTRILLAGLLAGLAVFAWESIAHMALPLGDAGIKPLSNEQAVVTLVWLPFGVPDGTDRGSGSRLRGRGRGAGEADQDDVAGIGPHRYLDRLTPVRRQSRLETKQSKRVVV